MRAKKGRGVSLTVLARAVLAETGVSLRQGRKSTLLATPDIDFLATAGKHRQVIQTTIQRHREQYPDRRLVLISHDGTGTPEVHTDLNTLAFLVSEAVKGNEAHWARPLTARPNTDDEGET